MRTEIVEEDTDATRERAERRRERRVEPAEVPAEDRKERIDGDTLRRAAFDGMNVFEFLLVIGLVRLQTREVALALPDRIERLPVRREALGENPRRRILNGVGVQTSVLRDLYLERRVRTAGHDQVRVEHSPHVNLLLLYELD